MAHEILAFDDAQQTPLLYADFVEVLMDLRHLVATMRRERKQRVDFSRMLKKRKAMAVVCSDCRAIVPSLPCFQCSSSK